MKSRLAWFTTVALLPLSARAADVLAVLEGGVMFHSGEQEKSLAGSFGQFLSLRAEKKKGFLRPQAALEIQKSGGKASILSAEPSYSLWGTAFMAGVHLFPFQEGKFRPFVGGSGVFSWHYMKLTEGPEGSKPQTQSFSFGYEAIAGVDIGKSTEQAYRIRGALWSVTSALGGVSGIQLNGFKFSIGYVF